MSYQLKFACGAVFDVITESVRPDITRSGWLKHRLVDAIGDFRHNPQLDGKNAPCFNCQAQQKVSKRKEQFGWIGENAIKPIGLPVRCVLCRPVDWRPLT